MIKEFFTKKRINELLNVTLGVALASLAYVLFLSPNNLVIGGVSGIGVILNRYCIPDALVMLIINIGLLILALVLVGKEFVLKTAYGAIIYPLFVALFNLLIGLLNNCLETPLTGEGGLLTTLDMSLVTLFASILMGIGLGIAMKHGGSTGGTEIPQMILFKKFHIPFSWSLYIIDGVVIILGLIFLGKGESQVLLKDAFSLTLYAIIFMFIDGVIMDMIIFSGFNKRAVYVISDKNEEIRKEVLDGFERGVTSIKVVGEYLKQDRTMLVCVLSSAEYYKLREIIEKYDPTAFYFTVRASEVRGEGFSYESPRK